MGRMEGVGVEEAGWSVGWMRWRVEGGRVEWVGWREWGLKEAGWSG